MGLRDITNVRPEATLLATGKSLRPFFLFRHRASGSHGDFNREPSNIYIFNWILGTKEVFMSRKWPPVWYKITTTGSGLKVGWGTVSTKHDFLGVVGWVMPVSCYCSFLICSAVCSLLVFGNRNPVAQARLMKLYGRKILKLRKFLSYRLNLFCE